MKKQIVLCSVSLALTLPLIAQAAPAQPQFTLQTCAEAGVDLTALVTPAAENSRTFYGGEVSVYNINTHESIARSAGIAIVMPGLEGQSQCTAIQGVVAMNVMAAKSSYNEDRGLLLEVPFSQKDPETEAEVPSPKALNVRIQLNRQSVQIEK